MTGRSSARSSFHGTGKRGHHPVGVTWLGLERPQRIVDRDLCSSKRHDIVVVGLWRPGGQAADVAAELPLALALAPCGFTSREGPEHLVDRRARNPRSDLDRAIEKAIDHRPRGVA